MKKATLISLVLVLLLTSFVSLKGFSQACTFVSPLVQVVNRQEQVINGQLSCVQTVNLTVDIDVNNGNKWTYIHIWPTAAWSTFAYGQAPTNANILNDDILTLALNYQNAPVLASTYAPDPTEDPQVQDAGDGVTFTTTPSVATPGATTFTFSNIKLVTVGACDPNSTFKGDSWSSQSANGGTVQCVLPGFTFATSDPTVAGAIICGTNNTMNFTVTANGVGNVISFQFDVFVNTNTSSAFDPNLDTKVYTGTTTYTVTQGTPTASQTFSSTTIPFYPTPYSNNNPYRAEDVYVVLKNIVIVNGTTTTTVANAVVTPVVNTCGPLPITFGEVKASAKGGQLVVDWQSTKEVNCNEYVVEASKDGVNWAAIGTLKSKAVNGNSDETLNYSFTGNLPLALGGLSIALLLFSIFKSRIFRIAMVVVVLGVLGSCLKNGNEVDLSKDGPVYIRIAQYDLNGSVEHSSIVKVIEE